MISSQYVVLVQRNFDIDVVENNVYFSIVFETRKDVGAECRHDMRPSVQVPTVN